jgi:hypothetical protein
MRNLTDVEVGEFVAIYYPEHILIIEKIAVVKRSSTTLTVANGYVFSRQTGMRRGSRGRLLGSSYGAWIEPLTPHAEARITACQHERRIRAIANKLYDFPWEELTEDDLSKILNSATDALKKAKGEQ